MAEQGRTGMVTMRGNPLTLIGPALKPGDKAPDFQCVAPDLTPVTLASSAGKARLLISVPSLDTPVCSTETIRFNREVAGLDLGKVEAVRWQGPDGFRENGILTYPPGFSPKRKLVL